MSFPTERTTAGRESMLFLLFFDVRLCLQRIVLTWSHLVLFFSLGQNDRSINVNAWPIIPKRIIRELIVRMDKSSPKHREQQQQKTPNKNPHCAHSWAICSQNNLHICKLNAAQAIRDSVLVCNNTDVQHKRDYRHGLTVHWEAYFLLLLLSSAEREAMKPWARRKIQYRFFQKHAKIWNNYELQWSKKYIWYTYLHSYNPRCFPWMVIY